MSKRKRHNPEQIVCKLQDADRLLNAGKSVEHVCQALEVSSATAVYPEISTTGLSGICIL